MNIQAFQGQMARSNPEKTSASQEHFIDLCRTLDVPTPADADPHGTFYVFSAPSWRPFIYQCWAIPKKMRLGAMPST